jgi:hypothetical protein
MSLFLFRSPDSETTLPCEQRQQLGNLRVLGSVERGIVEKT